MNKPGADLLRGCITAVALALVVAGSEVSAQARAGDDATPAATPLAASFQRMNEALALGLVGQDDAPSRWASGRLETMMPVQQVRDLGAAWARSAADMLYLSSLADACMRPIVPTPPECADRDVLGHWSSRDSGNAVPWLLQAERARRRNNIGSLVENLTGAARSARYDDYATRGAAVFASVLKPLVAETDHAAAVLYARQYGAAPLASPLAAMEAVCAPSTRQLEESISRHCIRLAGLMAERATNLVSRRAGAQVAQSIAATDSARAAAGAAARTVVALQDRCREALGVLERLAAGSAAERSRAVQVGERHLVEMAQSDEAAACESLHRSVMQR